MPAIIAGAVAVVKGCASIVAAVQKKKKKPRRFTITGRCAAGFVRRRRSAEHVSDRTFFFNYFIYILAHSQVLRNVFFFFYQ